MLYFVIHNKKKSFYLVLLFLYFSYITKYMLRHICIKLIDLYTFYIFKTIIML